MDACMVSWDGTTVHPLILEYCTIEAATRGGKFIIGQDALSIQEFTWENALLV